MSGGTTKVNPQSLGNIIYRFWSTKSAVVAVGAVGYIAIAFFAHEWDPSKLMQMPLPKGILIGVGCIEGALWIIYGLFGQKVSRQEEKKVQAQIASAHKDHLESEIQKAKTPLLEEIEQIKLQLLSATSEATTITTALTNNRTKVAELEADRARMLKHIQEISDTNASTVADLQESMADLQERIKQLESQLRSQETSFAAAAAKAGENFDRVSKELLSAKGELERSKGELEGVKTELDEAKAQLARQRAIYQSECRKFNEHIAALDNVVLVNTGKPSGIALPGAHSHRAAGVSPVSAPTAFKPAAAAPKGART